MGKIHVPPLSLLADALTTAGGLVEFVETGTDRGDVLPWASARFDRVTTIEIIPDSHQAAIARHGSLVNVRFILGDSSEVLPLVLRSVAGPALFWLDAHAGAGFYGPVERCPLLAELEIIGASPLQHCVIIDDARAFLAPPPPPFDFRRWPTLDQVVATAMRKPGMHVVAIEDALIIAPVAVRDVVAEFCRIVRPAI